MICVRVGIALCVSGVALCVGYILLALHTLYAPDSLMSEIWCKVYMPVLCPKYKIKGYRRLGFIVRKWRTVIWCW